MKGARLNDNRWLARSIAIESLELSQPGAASHGITPDHWVVNAVLVALAVGGGDTRLTAELLRMVQLDP